MFRQHSNIIYPYIDSVREYLEAGADAVVDEFDYHHRLQSHGITVSWDEEDCEKGGTLEISDNSECKTINILPKQTSYTLQFALRGTEYTVRLKSDTNTIETTFRTPYLGPRFLNLGGLYHNARDLGGYKAAGTKVLYNKVIRGSSPDNCRDASTYMITPEGTDFLQNTVKVRTQLDFRGTGENCGRTESSFKNAKYVQVPIAAYLACYTAGQAALYRDVFRVFADPDNYPIYMHCVGGADRTGTVAALLLALLGAERGEIVQDYVVTSFSPVCEFQGTRNKDVINPVLDGLNSYSGNTLAEKCASFLASIGVTKREIYNIRAIMLGLDINGYVPVTDYGIASVSHFCDTSSGKNLSIMLNDLLSVSSVIIDGIAFPYIQNERQITVSADSLSRLSDGEHKGRIVFEGGAETSFILNINLVDLTGDLQVVRTSRNIGYAYIDIKTSMNIFTGIGFHFHTRRATDFPDVENHILLNGKTLSDINDTSDVSGLKFDWSPGRDDARHRVPVTVHSIANTMRLIIKDEWLTGYLSGKPLEIIIKEGFNFTSDGTVYRVLKDIRYIETANGWMRC